MSSSSRSMPLLLCLRVSYVSITVRVLGSHGLIFDDLEVRWRLCDSATSSCVEVLGGSKYARRAHVVSSGEEHIQTISRTGILICNHAQASDTDPSTIGLT